MRLYSIEPSAFSARTAARDKVNFTLNAESIRKPAPMPQSNRVTDGVAVIDIRGVMLAAPDVFDEMFGGFVNTRSVQKQVEAAADDRAVKAIILRIDSPGGSVDGLAELGDAVSRARHQKPVIAQVEGLCASAAFYAASAASEISAGRMDLIGSIGTIVTIYDVSAAFKTAGIKTIVIASGQLKGTATLGTELTSAEEVYLRDIVNKYFDDFRRTVFSGRGRFIGPGEWAEIASGKVYVTSDAMKLGLVDRIGTFAGTMRRLAAQPLSPVQQTQARAQRQRLALMGVS